LDLLSLSLSLSLGFEGVHFCFDIGHAKVWADHSFADWLAFMARIQAAGVRLHMHLHANAGLIDEHRSFADIERQGNGSSPGTLPEGGYVAALATLAERFPGVNKIFEVPPAEALDNLDWVVEQIARYRAAPGPVVPGDRRP